MSSNKPPCRLFSQSGRCYYGDKCKFSHDECEASATHPAGEGEPSRSRLPHELHFLSYQIRPNANPRTIEQWVYKLDLPNMDIDVIQGLKNEPWLASLVTRCIREAHTNAGPHCLSFQRAVIGLLHVLTRTQIIRSGFEQDVKDIYCKLHPTPLSREGRLDFEQKIVFSMLDLLGENRYTDRLYTPRESSPTFYHVESWEMLCMPVAKFFFQIARWFPNDLGHPFYAQVVELFDEMSAKCEGVHRLGEQFRIIRDAHPWGQGENDVMNLTTKLYRSPGVVQPMRPLCGGPGEMLLPGHATPGNDFVDYRRIPVFPTAAEMEMGPAFLPSKAPNSWHPYLHAPEEVNVHAPDIFRDFPFIPDAALLDINFRLLREDCLDGIRSTMIAANHKNNAGGGGLALRFRTPLPVAVARVTAFREWSRTPFGLTLTLKETPKGVSKFTDKEYWEHSGGKKWLNPGSLCEVQSSNEDIKTALARVVSKEFKDGMLIVSVGGLGLEASGNEAIEAMIRLPQSHQNRILSVRHVFDDFFAYWPVLLSLQTSSGLPFNGRLSKRDDPDRRVVEGRDVPPRLPAYVTAQTKFRFDSVRLPGAGLLTIVPGEKFPRYDPKAIALDENQFEAVCHGLQNEIALIQGPPGTGKSYCGAAMLRILVDTFPAEKLGPILVMCMTNHALDQFLNEVKKTPCTRELSVIRLGARSKDPEMQKLTMFELRKQNRGGRRTTPAEWEIRNNFHSLFKRENNEETMTVAFKDVFDVIAEKNPELAETMTEAHDAFIEERWEIQGLDVAGMTPLEFWLKGLDRDGNGVKDDEEAILKQRREVIAEFQAIADDAARKEFRTVHSRYRAFKDTEDLRILRGADIIGVTTSKAAEMFETLSRLEPRVVLCEEAAEILESQLLAALNPTTEHLILIGDHLQLRPKPKKYELTRPSGVGYDLDVSTFERLIEEKTCQSKTLNVQRRMRPEIADMARSSLYPRLEDHPKVLEYDHVKGAKMNVVFFDHEFPETSQQEKMETSHGNPLEAAFVARLALYFLRQGYSGEGQLVVLTPYLGQLRLIRDELRKLRFDHIVIGEMDEEDLAKAADDETSSPSSSTTTTPVVKQKQLTECMRIATVDNFQGEEGDIVIFSSVRNNRHGRLGFLKETNRVNVALSRARKGLFILGNAHLLKNSPKTSEMWKSTLELMESRGQVRKDIPLVCSLHPDRETLVRTVEDLETKVADGGCELPCEHRLGCGHQCNRRCHPDDRDHLAVKCVKPCTRRCDEEGHPCDKLCFQPCRCDKPVENRVLPCGHLSQNLKCKDVKDLSKVRCTEKVTRELSCGHISPVVECWRPLETIVCAVPCDFEFLGCGHLCGFKSHVVCDAMETGKVHLRCPKLCPRPRECEHDCHLGCGHAGPCPPCRTRCSRRCEHSKCSKKCFEACAPCVEEECSNACPHTQCTIGMCSAPCNRILCDEPCGKKLEECGHPCPSLCGEVCPKSARGCRVCAKDKDQKVDLVMMTSLKECPEDELLIQLECGHVFTVEYLDAQMGVKKFFDLSTKRPIEIITSEMVHDAQYLRCPHCRKVDHRVKRYQTITKLAELSNLSFKFAREMRTTVDDVTSKAFALLSKSASTAPAKSTTGKVLRVKEGEKEENPLEALLSRVTKDYRDPLMVALPHIQSEVLDLRWRDQLRIIQSALEASSSDSMMEQFIQDSIKALKTTLSRVNECVVVTGLQLALAFLMREYTDKSKLMSLGAATQSIEFHTDVGRRVKAMIRDAVDREGAREALEVMMRQFGSSQGWYGRGHANRCPNGHVYFIGECGGAMEMGRCPDCGEAVGGRGHTLLGTNRAGMGDEGERTG